MFITNLLLVVLIIVALVLVHELGHFLMAITLGIKVEEFGIGYPPRITGKVWRGVLYTINWLPFGGFVRLKGEFGDENSKDKDSFNQAPVSSRIFVVIAGVVMNFLLAWVLLAGAFMVGFSPLTHDISGYPGAKITRQQVTIAAVQSGSAAEQAGLQPGDILEQGNGANFQSVVAVQDFTLAHRGETVDLTINRDGSDKTIKATLGNTDKGQLGTAIIDDQLVKLPFWSAIRASLNDIWGLSKLIVGTVGSIIKGIFTTSSIPEGVVGPVGIYQITSAAVQSGFSTVLTLIIILSVNFALINILPFPALDGGRLVFLLLEGVFRKRVVKEQVEAAITTVGFILLLMLIILLTYRDIVRLT